jgi:hypothetical protein
MVHGVKIFEDSLSEVLEPFDNCVAVELVSIFMIIVEIEEYDHNITKKNSMKRTRTNLKANKKMKAARQEDSQYGRIGECPDLPSDGLAALSPSSS